MSKAKDDKIHIPVDLDDRGAFTAVVLVTFLLCGCVYALNIPFLINVFAADFGILSNLTIIFYLIIMGVIGFVVYEHRKKLTKSIKKDWKRTLKQWSPKLLMLLLCIVMICEEMKWFITLVTENPDSYSVKTIKDIIIGALSEVPDGAKLHVTMAVAGFRFAIIAVILYGIGFLLYFREQVVSFLKDEKNGSLLFFSALFFIFIFCSILTGAYGFRGSRIFEQATEFLASVTLLTYILNQKSAEKALSKFLKLANMN